MKTVELYDQETNEVIRKEEVPESKFQLTHRRLKLQAEIMNEEESTNKYKTQIKDTDQ